MIRHLSRIAILALVGAFAATAALAQVPSTQPPYNTDMGAVLTNTLRTAGSAQSTQQTNLANLGIVCTYLQTAVSGTPSVIFSIQGFDAATNSYLTYASTAAITGTTVPGAIMVYPGSVATSVPTGMVVAGLHLPLKWRLSQTIGGTSGPASTGSIGCNYLR